LATLITWVSLLTGCGCSFIGGVTALPPSGNVFGAIPLFLIAFAFFWFSYMLWASTAPIKEIQKDQRIPPQKKVEAVNKLWKSTSESIPRMFRMLRRNEQAGDQKGKPQ
jgi:hypothetical protein